MPATLTLPEAAVAFYELGQRFSAAGVLAIRELWRRMTLGDIDRGWSAISADAVLAIAALQVASARAASGYVTDVLDEQGMDAPSVATLAPLAFARGSSGLPLPEVLTTVPAAVKRSVGAGAGEQALARGLSLLEGIAQTQIADAARLATVTEMTARPAVQMWTRVLNPPSCGRCAVLAGSQYSWNASFQRHPRCDCRALPSTVAAGEGRLFDARTYFDSLPAAEQDLRFGRGVAEQIRGGEDLVKAVNASRDRWRVRVAQERSAAKKAADLAATGATTATSPQTFLESLVHQVNDRPRAIRNLADAGFVAA